MQKTKLLVAVLSALSAMPAFAADAPSPITANVGIVSNYVFRGIAQNSTDPAIQGGFDYAHSSGLYAGVWGSNINWIANSGAVASGSVSMELDTYFGYKGSMTSDVGYDVGFVRYNYVGDYSVQPGFVKADTAEIYAAISYMFLTAKYSYSVMNGFLTVPDSRGTNYIELNANYTIPDTSFTLIGHVGKQTYKGDTADWLATVGFDPSYSDYKVGVSKDFSGYVATIAYSKTDTPDGGFYDWPATGGNWGKGMIAVSLTHSF